MSKPSKPLPRFKNEAEERAFWETPGRDSTDYLDWSRAQRVALPRLKADRAAPRRPPTGRSS